MRSLRFTSASFAGPERTSLIVELIQRTLEVYSRAPKKSRRFYGVRAELGGTTLTGRLCFFPAVLIRSLVRRGVPVALRREARALPSIVERLKVYGQFFGSVSQLSSSVGNVPGPQSGKGATGAGPPEKR